MNNNSWDQVPISQIVEVIGGGTPKTTISEYWNGDIPWISVADFGSGRKFIFDTEKKITKLGLENSSTKILKKGQIIISARGTVGEIGVTTKEMAFNQSCYGINAKDQTFNEFLYYLLVHNINQFKKKTHGSVFETITRETFDQIIVDLPPIPVQQKIASILGALDDKIELNRRMNKTLETIAQALFRHWFVENPETERWEEKPLDEIANFLNGLAMQKFSSDGEEFLPVIKIAQLHKGDSGGADKASTNLPSEYIVEDGDILFSWSGSLEVVIWCGGKGALNQHLFKVTSREYPKWFYYFWVKQYLPDFQEIAAGKATTMGHIQRHHLSDAIVKVPGKEFLAKMDKVLTPIVNLIIGINIEIRQLNNIRDALLPVLLTGSIKLSYREDIQ